MDTFNPNQMPNVGQVQPEKKPVGPLIAVIIILVLIIVGGLYFLKERSSQNTQIPVPENSADTITETLKQQSTSDNLNSIEQDLNNTNVDNIDQGSSAIQSQLQQ